jgi:hypothetical protein
MTTQQMMGYLSALGALYSVMLAVTGGYVLYFKSQKRRMEDAMTALSNILATHATRINTLERESVNKEDQRRVDDGLRGEISGLRTDISSLREQQHDDTMAVVRSITSLQQTITNTLSATIADAVARVIGKNR